MKYTALEIHQMRKLTDAIWQNEKAADTGGWSDQGRAQEVEMRLLTYMSNGTTVAELEAEATRVRGLLRERLKREHERSRV